MQFMFNFSTPCVLRDAFICQLFRLDRGANTLTSFIGPLVAHNLVEMFWIMSISMGFALPSQNRHLASSYSSFVLIRIKLDIKKKKGGISKLKNKYITLQ